MATSKTKGTSKKIKELKSIEDIRPKRVTDAQLEKVQLTVNNLNKSQLEIGSIELRKHDLLHGIAGLRDQLTVMQKEFEEQYGTFDIDIQDGTINYPAEKPEENGETN